MDYEKASILKSFAQQNLLNLLGEIRGEKDLIIDEQIIQGLDLVVSFKVLKTNGVRKIFKLEEGILSGLCNRRVYLVRSDVNLTKIIANHIIADVSQGISTNDYWIIYIPRILKSCDVILEEEGVYGHVKTLEYPLCLIPLDNDLFSLEMEGLFSSFFMNSDQSHLHYIASTISQTHKLVGGIKNIYGFGKFSKMICKIFSNFDEEPRDQVSDAHLNCIDSSILIDRDLDYASVLLSQSNYEGLLDETFGIKSGKVNIPPEVYNKDKLSTDKHILHSSDPIYRDIRDCHLTVAFSRLKQKGQYLKSKHTERQDMDLAAMKNFVANELKLIQAQYKSLSLHISICEVAMDKKKENEFLEQLNVEGCLIEGRNLKECMSFIEEAIIRQLCPFICLRLLCLLSFTQDGLSAKDYKHLITLFIQSFGHEYLTAIYNLKRLGLLTESTTNKGPLLSPTSSVSNNLISGKVAAAMSAFPRTTQFRTVAKRFNLIPPGSESGYDLSKPRDPAFVFGGNYVPLLCRLIETILGKSDLNASSEELLKSLSGDYSLIKKNGLMFCEGGEKIIFVFVIGGITFAEVSALRFIALQNNVKIFVASTSIVNGNKIIKQTLSS